MSSGGPSLPGPSRPIVGGGRSRWTVAAAGLLLVLFISVETFGAHHAAGSHGLPAGSRLPPFAAPLVRSSFPDDAAANIARVGHTNGQAGRVPACDVRSPGAFNVCVAAAHRPLVLAFFTTASSGCVRALDTIEQVRSAFPGVAFAAVAILGDRGKLRALVRSHGWSFPVAYDRDGAVTNLYRVGVCPAVTLAYAGGRVMRTVLGGSVERPAALRAYVRALVARAGAAAGSR